MINKGRHPLWMDPAWAQTTATQTTHFASLPISPHHSTDNSLSFIVARRQTRREINERRTDAGFFSGDCCEIMPATLDRKYGEELE